MKKRLLLSYIVACLAFCNLANATDVKNVDTPNLDFSQGEGGWTYQVGWYTTTLKGAVDEYMYIWDNKSVGVTSPIAKVDISGYIGNTTYALSDEEKSRFWHYDNPQIKDRKFLTNNC